MVMRAFTASPAGDPAPPYTPPRSLPLASLGRADGSFPRQAKRLRVFLQLSCFLIDLGIGIYELQLHQYEK